MSTSGWLDVLGRDLKFTRRLLRKNFTFTATAIVTLALGIAASTVIFSVVDAVLLNPLAYNEPDDVYRIHTVDTLGLPRGSTGAAHIEPMVEAGESIRDAYYGYSLESSVVNREGTAFAVNDYRVSEGFFGVFTEPLALGRALEAGDDFRNTVLSYQVWRDVFGSDPDIVGSPIQVSGSPLNVVGVAAEGFEFPVGAGMWTKVFQGPQTRALFNMEGYVRVNPGVSRAALQAELNVLAGRLGPWPDGRPLELVARPLLQDVVGDLRSTVLIVSGATTVLLLIACLNVANLLLARGVARSSEFALREALGARSWRVFRQLMTESFVLCSLGGVLGLGLAVGAVQLLRAIGPADLPRFGTLTIDQNVFLFAAGCVLLVALAVGLAPALRVSRGDLSALINSGGRSAAVAPGRNRIFGALVIAEIALAVVLVIGAGLLVRSYSQLSSADPGFDPQRMLTLVLNVPGRRDIGRVIFDQERRVPTGFEGTGDLPVARFYQELASRIGALPGVASVAAASSAPLHQGRFPVNLATYPVIGSSAAVDDQLAYGNQVAPEFFATLGIRPTLGRVLEPTDRRGAPGVAVVNQTFVRTYLDGGNPLGRRLTLPAPEAWSLTGAAFQGGLGERVINEVEIVGVIPDIKQRSLQDVVQPAVYMTQEQWTLRRMAVLVRADIEDPATLIPAIQRELAAMDSTIPGVFSVYSDVLAASLARHRLATLVLVVFGLVSLTLAAVGTYGLISFSVNQRFNEIAVRSAFGAERGNLLGMFVKRALQLAAIGVVFGVAGAIAMRQVVASQLYEVSAFDPWVFAIVPVTMLAVTAIASYLPARRASRIDVTVALREN